MGAPAEVHCYTYAEYERKLETLPRVRSAAEHGVDLLPSPFCGAEPSRTGEAMTPILSLHVLLRTQSDARLLASWRPTGPSAHSRRLWSATAARCTRWCGRVLPEARAEDAVQTTFLKAWTAIPRGDRGR